MIALTLKLLALGLLALLVLKAGHTVINSEDITGGSPCSIGSR